MAGRDEAKRMDEVFEQLLEQLGDKIASGLAKGVEEAGLFERLLELVQNLNGRIEELEEEVRQLKAQKESKPKATVAEMARAFGMPLPLGSNRPTPSAQTQRPRLRSRQPSRPTVIYRSSLKPAVKESRDCMEPEGEEGGICSEPGCERSVRCRGLCSLHYQRVRYKERKIETKVEQGGMPPLPPPKRPVGQQKRTGGTKGVFALLYDEKGRKVISGFINQIKYDRCDLVDRLNVHFAGLPGLPLEEEDVVRAVHYHKLGENLRAREADILGRHLSKQRGSLVKAAQKMKMDVERLKLRIRELEMEDEVARIRHDFRESIMEHSSFSERLDLALTREKYLVDLDIVEEVDNSLQKELCDKLATMEDLDLQAKEQAIREAFGLDEQRYRRLVRRYGDAEPLAHLKAACAEGS